MWRTAGPSPMMALGVVLALACAVQGSWSPCGLSMLSTITPLGERARHHAYAWSACWYIAGAAIGGACLGACLLVAARAFAAVPHAVGAGLLVLGLGVSVCLAGDARIGGFRLPDVPRQLNERWVGRMRPWAYASGFGWQVGTGVATYVMTNGVYALILLAVVALPPLEGLVVGVLFGTSRGMCLLVGARVRTPEQLRSLHFRLDRLAPWSIALPALAEIAVLAYVVVRSRSTLAIVVGIGASIFLGVTILHRSWTRKPTALVSP